MPKYLLLYDGICGLCHRFVRFALHWDRKKLLMFAPLQGALARECMARHGRDAAAMESVVLLVDGGTAQERVLLHSAAVVEVLQRLAMPMPLLGKLLAMLPGRLSDWGYGVVARNRYRIFGTVGMEGDACALPIQEERARFLSTESNESLLH